MARDIRRFEISIPAGTTKANPASFDMSFPPRVASQINVRVPPGPNGLMGFRIAYSGTPIIPMNQGSWITANDDRMEWPLTDYLDGGAWSLIGYNTGIYAHMVFVTFLLDLVGAVPVTTPVQPLTGTDLVQAPTVDLTPPPLILDA